MRRRAFSLVEVAVAGSIATVIGVAAITTFAVLMRQVTRLQAESGASDAAKTIIDALVSELQGVGGGAVRPWMAVWVEDGGDAASVTRHARFGQRADSAADRVTWATSAGLQCPVVAWSASTATVASTGTGTGCCLQQLVSKAGFAMTTGARNAVHAIVVAGTAHRQVALDQLDAATCTMRFTPGPLTAIDANPAADFTSGVVEAVSVETLFLDEQERRLKRFVDRRGFDGANVTIDADELQTLGSNAFDLQVQLGYDGDPADGRLVDRGDATDEWQFNVAGDALPAGVAADDLRMIGVGVIVGAPIADPEYRTSAQVVGGEVVTRAGQHLRSAMGRAALRNIFVFF